MFRRNFFASLFAGFAACFVPFKRKADAVEGTEATFVFGKTGDVVRMSSSMGNVSDDNNMFSVLMPAKEKVIGVNDILQCVGTLWTSDDPEYVRVTLARVPQTPIEVDFGESKS